jgi:hypothetical protein
MHVANPAEKAKAKPQPETTILQALMKVLTTTRRSSLNTKKGLEMKKAQKRVLISHGVAVFSLSIIAASMGHATPFRFRTPKFRDTASGSAQRMLGVQPALATRKKHVVTLHGCSNNSIELNRTLDRD